MFSDRVHKKLVYTIKDRCRVCYTCVRECPVKAIKIMNGQAEVIPERCIGCGNCTRVCSQDAKAFLSTINNVKELFLSDQKVAALLAPSFAAEFEEFPDHKTLVGMMRALGFNYVIEVAFGADIVAMEYRKILGKKDSTGYISSDCPAIVSYIERYHPELISSLAPIASPMVAIGRIVKRKYGSDVKLVFIGPCIAKKSESEEIDEALTFRELREMFSEYQLLPENTTPSDFDPPIAGKGAVFPISRGMLQTVGVKDNIVDLNIIVAEGKINFLDAIKEYKEGLIEPQHLELLCCEGCIMGPGMSKGGKQYTRRLLVGNYVRNKLNNNHIDKWEKEVEESMDVNLKVIFTNRDQRTSAPDDPEIIEVLRSMGKFSEKDHLDCGACGYETCRDHAIAIALGQAEIEMCLPSTIDKLHDLIQNLAVSNDKLVSVQQALKQSEKLAHMGQLSAGIAHELNNPLGVIIMYSNILLDECATDSQNRKDLELIVEQSARCKKIVGGLLNFARKNQVNHASVDINDFIRQCVNSIIIPDNVDMNIESKIHNPIASIDSEQMIQVVSNLLKNAIEAMPDGGKLNITLDDNENEVIFVIEDSGSGIDSEDLEKVFEPFYTTKGLGKGTGLGLATAYGIVKMHKGQISVDSNTDNSVGETGTIFTIVLPRNKDEIVIQQDDE